MGYSARYHAASLAAVFLALAAGILIGVGFGSDLVSGTAEDLERSLESDLDDARAQIDALEGELASEREFGQAVYPMLVAGRLAAERIAVIGLGGLDAETSDQIEAAVAPAGATVAAVAVVREAPDVEALAATARGPQARALARGDEAELLAYGERAGRALVRGGAEFDQVRANLLSRFSGEASEIDSAVVVRQPPADLDQEAEKETAAIEEGLLAGLTGSVRVVGVERSDSDPSSIEYFESQGLSSVDSVDRNAGQVALVFALDGASGSFGIKETADGLLPDLLAPPSEAEGAGG